MKGKTEFKARLIVLAIIIFVLIIKGFVLDYQVIKGQSMSNTYNDGEVVFIEKISRDFSRGTVIVLRDGEGLLNRNLIKRIVGVPNDEIQIINGKVHINGAIWFDDPCADIFIKDAGIAFEKITLGEDEYFVLGDNRNESADSRVAEIGIIKGKNILGVLLNQR